MKYYLENSRVVIRGKKASGERYRLFVKLEEQTIVVDPKQWNQKKQALRGAPVINQYLKDLKTRLDSLVMQKKVFDLSYGIPEAYAEIFPSNKAVREKLPDKVVEAIAPYVRDQQGNKSAGYLRHFTQLKTELTAWNRDVKFSELNDITLTGYLLYLKGEGEPKRKPLKPATIGHHFKHLRQVAKYASQRGVKVDPAVFDFNPGRVTYSHGCFDLTFDELMILWHHTPANEVEELVLDYCLLEGFTGIRNGDISSFKEDGTQHGIKCGDIGKETISYRDRKNDDIVKTVTRHKFNERIIQKYLQDDINEFLMPPLAQQTVNRVIKTIARNCGLERGVRRGSEVVPVHQALSSHCFRSTYGNLLFQLGISQELVGEELGHTPATVTGKHYLNFSRRHDLIRGKINKLEIKKHFEGHLKKAV